MTRTRTGLTAMALALAVVAAACGGSGGGEETAAEEAETPKSSSEVAAEEALARTADPSKMQVELTAEGVAFDKDRIEVPAGEAFQIVLDNRDDLEHNLAVYETISGVPVFRHPMFQGELVRGPVEIVYDVPALEAGTYVFYCDAHIAEKMSGDFVVE